jgi:hypothetical protein
LRPNLSGAVLPHTRRFDIEIVQTRHKIDARDHASVLLKKQPRWRAVIQGLPYSAEHEKTRLLSGL